MRAPRAVCIKERDRAHNEIRNELSFRDGRQPCAFGPIRTVGEDRRAVRRRRIGDIIGRIGC